MPEPAIASGVVFVVRHGRTGLNAAGVLRGRLDVPLDEVGRDEAKRLGEIFADTPLLVVVTSPLTRARETAAPIAAATGAALEVEDALLDRDYGPFAGRRQADAEAAYGNIDRAPGVEPPGAFAARVTGALRRLAGRATDGPVAVVAHEAVNQVALARLVPELAGLPARIGQRTGCWNRLEVVAGTWRAPVVDAVPGDGHRPWPEENGGGADVTEPTR